MPAHNVDGNAEPQGMFYFHYPQRCDKTSIICSARLGAITIGKKYVIYLKRNNFVNQKHYPHIFPAYRAINAVSPVRNIPHNCH